MREFNVGVGRVSRIDASGAARGADRPDDGAPPGVNGYRSAVRASFNAAGETASGVPQPRIATIT